MARPKGSKNKTEGAYEPTAEFNYDDSDVLYQQVMSQGAVAPAFEDPANAVSEITARHEVVAAPTAAAAPTPVATSSTFFVEGKVRLDQDGNSPVFADQRRIVNAASADEALSKFVSYFTGMSNASQRYTVVQAGASETIL
jgi:hypothetical protein